MVRGVASATQALKVEVDYQTRAATRPRIGKTDEMGSDFGTQRQVVPYPPLADFVTEVRTSWHRLCDELAFIEDLPDTMRQVLNGFEWPLQELDRELALGSKIATGVMADIYACLHSLSRQLQRLFVHEQVGVAEELVDFCHHLLQKVDDLLGNLGRQVLQPSA